MIVGITGGKGGTGKSVIATSLAYELSKKYKVMLIDADVDCPNDHLILSIKRIKEKTVFQTIPKWDYKKCIKCGACSKACKEHAIVFVKNRFPIFIPEQCIGCKACIVSCPVNAIGEHRKKIGTIYSGAREKLKFFSGESVVGYKESSRVVSSLLNFVNPLIKDYDYVIIDTAAGTHCNVITALMKCDFALAVTEPTPFGIHDLRLIIKLLKILGLPYKTVLNKSTINKKLKLKGLIAKIPYKESILKAYCKGIPIEDESIKNLAKAFEEVLI